MYVQFCVSDGYFCFAKDGNYTGCSKIIGTPRYILKELVCLYFTSIKPIIKFFMVFMSVETFLPFLKNG